MVLRLCFIAALVGACAGSPQQEGASRTLAAAVPPASRPLQAAAADAMLIAEPAQGASWHAFLGADGSARRMDGAEGSWQVDAAGRLCTRFADRRNCWWMQRDGSSEPVFRGEQPGERARLAHANAEL